MSVDIAIAGIAVRLADSENLEAFHQNLVDGKDCIRQPSLERLANSTMPLERDYQDGGWIENVDQFDHKFFNYSLSEAQHIDPHQRIALGMAYHAIENSGLNIDDLRGTRTGVINANAEYEYVTLLDSMEGTMYNGNMTFAQSGRISRAFDLRGNAITMDTGCSAMLAGIGMACDWLRLGHVDYMLVTGSRFFISAPEKTLFLDITITSGDGRTRSFSSQANGSGSAEGAAAFLLMPLEKALEQKLVVHGVIKGYSMNQSGIRAGSLSATSAQAQKDAILQAWKLAGVDPKTIGYWEPHGSGTKLGDPVEIEGLTRAFREFTDEKQFCALSCVKTNVGHTDRIAGVAGLAKACLSLKHKEFYPNLHFHEPNPLIDFENSPIYINTEHKPWPKENGTPRRAGVTSLGFAGNNAHVVVEEAPEMEPEAQSAADQVLLFTVSGKRAYSLTENIRSLRDFLLRHPEADLRNVARTLNKGRKDYDHRFVCMAEDHAQLIEMLDSGLNSKAAREVPNEPLKKLIFLISGDQEVPEPLVAQLMERHTIFRDAYTDCLDQAPSKAGKVPDFAFSYAWYKLLEAYGIHTGKVIGLGYGDLLFSVLQGGLELSDALEQAASLTDPEFSDLEARMERLIDREAESERIALIELGAKGSLSKALANLDYPDADDYFFNLYVDPESPDCLQELFAILYRNQYQPNWDLYYQHHAGCMTELPGYVFEPTRVWAKEPHDMDLVIRVREAMQAGNLEKVKEELGLGKSHQEIKNESLPAEVPDFIPPENWNAVEKQLAAIWAVTLKVPSLTLDDDFFKLGGHSLLGLQLTNRIARTFNIQLDFKDIFQAPTVGLLAAVLEKRLQGGQGAAQFQPIPQAPAAEYYPLSYAQRRLWMIHNLESEGTLAYNLPMALRLSGKVDAERIQGLIQQLINRHEAFRTSFHLVEGEPVQKIHADVAFELEVSAVSSLDEGVQAFIRPFDLEQAPLIRAGLLSNPDGDQVLVYDMHHIISDGTSVEQLSGEFFQLLQGKEPEQASIQYKDYAVWQQALFNSAELAEHGAWWKAQFSETPVALELPYDFPRPQIQDFSGATHVFELGTEKTAALKALASQEGVTTYMLLLALYSVFLSRESGQEDVVIGTPVSGRHHADLEGLVGAFINTLALRNQVSDSLSFSTFLQNVKTNTLAAFQHEVYPFELLVTELNLDRNLGRNPLFDAQLLYHNLNLGTGSVTDEGAVIASGDDMQISGYNFEKGASQLDLTLIATESESGLIFGFEYASALFKAETIARLSQHFLNLIDQVLAGSAAALGDLSVLSSGEKQGLIESWETNLMLPVPDASIPALIDAAARNQEPDSVAVQCGTRSLSRGELVEQSDKMGRWFAANPNKLVAVMLPRTPELLVGLLGVMKGGAAYLPLDYTIPTERLEYILQDSGADIILTDASGAERVRQLGLKTERHIIEAILKVDEVAAELPAIRSDQLAYLMYTSGSTGRPKGIRVSHHNLQSFTQNLTTVYGFEAGDRILAQTTIGFDISFTETLGALACGLEVIMATDDEVEEPAAIGALVAKAGVIQMTPSRLRQVLDLSGAAVFQNLKTLLLGAESLPDDLRQLVHSWGLPLVLNQYGPTETTVFSTVSKVDDLRVNIGTALKSEALYVLNDHLQPVPAGVPGDLYIGGAGVSLGYHNRAALTEASFLAHPWHEGFRLYKTGDRGRWLPEGRFEFLGRMDDQIKLRGFRIEPGEIEASLRSLSVVKEAAVIMQGTGADARLVCFWVRRGTANGEQGDPDFMTLLAPSLPAYMIPARYFELERLPLNASGKTDRKALVRMIPTGVSATRVRVAPEGPVQRQIAEIWESVLGISEPGIHDNFFELGGHSLRATQVVARLRQAFGRQLSLRQLFQTPTIAGLAMLMEGEAARSLPVLKPAGKREVYPLSDAQRRMLLLHERNPQALHYNISGALLVKGKLEADKVQVALSTLIQRHAALRTSFEFKDGEPVQQLHVAPELVRIQKLETDSLSGNFYPAEGDFELIWLDAEGASPESLIASLRQPFHLGAHHLFRVVVATLSADLQLLFYDMHHIISDGTSLGILIREFGAAYQGASLPALPVQYYDYAVWQQDWINNGGLDYQEQYWLEKLAAPLPVLQLLTDHPRDMHVGDQGAVLFRAVDAEVSEALQAFALKEDVTLFMVLMAIYKVLLYRYTGQEDLIVGTVVAGRTHPDLQPLLGMFVNTLAIRTAVKQGQSFRSFLNHVKESSLEAFDHQDYSFDRIVEKLGLGEDSSRNPVFDTLLVLQNMDLGSGGSASENGNGANGNAGLPEMESVGIADEHSKFDLSLEFQQAAGQLHLKLEYRSSLFEAGTIEKIIRDFEATANAVLNQPDIGLGEIEYDLSFFKVEQEVEDFDFDL